MIAATANEILERVTVITIYSALGGEVPRRGNRTRCILHRGDNLTFSINEQKGVWICFACNESGGKVALVQRAIGVQPKAALEWIAQLAGLSLAHCSREEQRARAIAFNAAEDEGRQLIEWRIELLEYLREKRACIQIVYWWAIRRGDHEAEKWLWESIRSLDRKIDWHEAQSWDVMVHIYRNSLELDSFVVKFRRAA